MVVRQSKACIYNIPTKDIHVALFLTEINFPTISNRQNQSVVNAFIYVLSPTHVHKGRNRRETKAKVRILIDITPFFIRKAHI